jgi:H+/gluconate symporter-like permease
MTLMTVLFSDPLFILLIGVIIVVGGIIVLQLHPFLALILAAFVVALLTARGVCRSICDCERIVGGSRGGIVQKEHRRADCHGIWQHLR